MLIKEGDRVSAGLCGIGIAAVRECVPQETRQAGVVELALVGEMTDRRREPGMGLFPSSLAGSQRGLGTVVERVSIWAGEAGRRHDPLRRLDQDRPQIGGCRGVGGDPPAVDREVRVGAGLAPVLNRLFPAPSREGDVRPRLVDEGLALDALQLREGRLSPAQHLLGRPKVSMQRSSHGSRTVEGDLVEGPGRLVLLDRVELRNVVVPLTGTQVGLERGVQELVHERPVTEAIRDLVALADHPTSLGLVAEGEGAGQVVAGAEPGIDQAHVIRQVDGTTQDRFRFNAALARGHRRALRDQCLDHGFGVRHPSHAQRLIGGRNRLLMPLGQHLGPGELGVCPGQLGDLTQRLGLLDGRPQGLHCLDPPCGSRSGRGPSALRRGAGRLHRRPRDRRPSPGGHVRRACRLHRRIRWRRRSARGWQRVAQHRA